ncbi:MAG: N-acetylmuramoyl-L-alanine amidase [Endomicrobiales bacterium]|nr:N-acetylmuramoyl-L-alanine amidase [Endomicrobiales bacterium]
MIKKHLFLLIVLFTLFASAAFAVEKESIIPVVDGESKDAIWLYKFSAGDYFLAQDVANVYKAVPSWKAASGKVSLSMNNQRLDIFVKSSRASLNGKPFGMKLPSKYVSGKLYVPTSLLSAEKFSDFSGSKSEFNKENGVLTVEKIVNVYAPRFYSKYDETVLTFAVLENLDYAVEQSKNQLELQFLRGRVFEETVGIDDGVIKEVALKNTGRMAKVIVRLEEGAGNVEVNVLSKPLRVVVSVVRTDKAGPLPDSFKGECVIEGSTQTINTEFVSSMVQEEIASTDTANQNTQIIKSAAQKPALAKERKVSVKNRLQAPQEVEKFKSLKAAVVTEPVAIVGNREPSIRGRRKVLVLDAGHGGHDPGAVGKNGTNEKDINLKIVQELKALFEEDGAFDVYLTREDDTFIPLYDRASFANHKKADLFVSVHCNASLDRDLTGFEIYFLSENASSPEAAATEILENSVIKLEAKSSQEKSRLENILASMVINEFINEASELCCFVSGEVVKRTSQKNRGVMQAGFYVLRGTQMPSVLVETAFISNPGEEAKLNSENFRQKTADSIYDAVKKYFARRESMGKT